MVQQVIAEINSFDSSQYEIKIDQEYTKRGCRYHAHMVHRGIAKNRSIMSSDLDILKQKVIAQVHVWDELWRRQVEANRIKEDRIRQIQDKEDKNSQAQSKTLRARAEIEALKSVLQFTLSINDAINWEGLKDTAEFNKPKPRKHLPPPPAKLMQPPTEPEYSDDKYAPKIGFLDMLIAKRKKAKAGVCKEMFEKDHDSWQKYVVLCERESSILLAANESTLKKIEQIYEQSLQEWAKQEAEFKHAQHEMNASVDARKEQFLGMDSDAILDYCDMVLYNSKYPSYFPKESSLDYNRETKILLVEFRLPSLEDLPKVKEVKYSASMDEFVEVALPDAEIGKVYDDLIYQIALRTIHELYESDVINAIEMVVFNGYVRTIDTSHGNEIVPCILSLQAKREEFLKINLATCDAKACFKSLNGVASSKLSSITPVAPIMQISREDKRFIEGYNVVDGVQEGDNLAAMDWEDFEHLIREIFEKEFASTGGEVKVTQASRDGGVDAVIFDPDPIRGGKIIVQAKRYTNTV